MYMLLLRIIICFLLLLLVLGNFIKLLSQVAVQILNINPHKKIKDNNNYNSLLVADERNLNKI